ncbi:hypothetical protein GCM10023317_64170 [Actinopolymorpha pittospori]
MLYVGIGAHAHLMACPGGGPTCTDILPPEYAEEEFAYSVSAGAGHGFVNLSPSGDGHLVVLKVTKHADGSVSAATVRDIPTVKYPGASPVVDGSVYYVGNNRLSRYDIATDTATSLGRGLPVGPRAWGVDTAGGKPVLTTMGNSSNGPTVVRYDIDGDTLTSVSAADAPAIPTDLQSIQTGPDGKIYSSGFRSGTVGIYTPMRSDLSVGQNGISQAEGSTTIGDTLYWGTSPGAIVYAYRPSQPWKSGTNPKVVCSLTAQDQDRPYGMVNADGKLYIGTMAGYGKLEGRTERLRSGDRWVHHLEESRAGAEHRQPRLPRRQGLRRNVDLGRPRYRTHPDRGQAARPRHGDRCQPDRRPAHPGPAYRPRGDRRAGQPDLDGGRGPHPRLRPEAGKVRRRPEGVR